MGLNETSSQHYAAFISYAHADEVMAARLHRALETYPVPRRLRAQGKGTKPVFRDVAELTAAHSLSEKIQDALKASHALIVLCSPAAKASRWVNEEIRLFRALHGDGAILSALIEGTPRTSFPQALTEGGYEPLAASLGGDKAGFKLGVTQLAAGLLGTGLDDLVQRRAKRRNRLMGAGLAASLALSGILGFTTLQAVEARNEAQLERSESEALLEYMVKDLKVKLEPAGRLELLEGVGRKAVDYYKRKDIDALTDDNLTTLAAARQVLAQVALDAGRMEEAQNEIDASADLTRELLARNPDDTDAIYAHAQSEYWVGLYYRKQGKLEMSEKPWREYNSLVQVLYQKDPTNYDWVMEAAWGQNNLGVFARESYQLDLIDAAANHYDNAIRMFEEAQKLKPDSKNVDYEIANSLGGRSFVELATASAKSAREIKKQQLSLRENLEKQYPESIPVKVKKVMTLMDYYDGFFLSHSKDKAKDIRETIEQFYILTLYDIDNSANMEYFLNAALNDFEDLSVESLKDRRAKIVAILNLYKKKEENNSKFYELSLAVLDIKINIYEEKLPLAKQKLITVKKDVSDIKNTEKNLTNLYYGLMLRSQELGLFELAEHSAKDLLRSSSLLSSELRYPTLSEKRIAAYSQLGMCEKMKPLMTDLVTRGYASEAWQNAIQCA